MLTMIAFYKNWNNYITPQGMKVQHFEMCCCQPILTNRICHATVANAAMHDNEHFMFNQLLLAQSNINSYLNILFHLVKIRV